jgi:hypothetical protein
MCLIADWICVQQSAVLVLKFSMKLVTREEFLLESRFPGTLSCKCQVVLQCGSVLICRNSFLHEAKYMYEVQNYDFS